MKVNFTFLFGFDIEKVKIIQMVDCNAEIYNTKLFFVWINNITLHHENYG